MPTLIDSFAINQNTVCVSYLRNDLTTTNVCSILINNIIKVVMHTNELSRPAETETLGLSKHTRYRETQASLIYHGGL